MAALAVLNNWVARCVTGPWRWWVEDRRGGPRVTLGFPQVVREAIPEERLNWKSRQLSALPIATNTNPAERVVRIVNDILDPKSQLTRQVKRLARDAGPELRENVMKATDALLCFSPDYWELLEKVEGFLPQGNILDLEAGTLNLSAYFLMKSPRRRLVAAGLTPTTFEIGYTKLERLFPSDLGDHRFLGYSLLSYSADGLHADATILCNVPFPVGNHSLVFRKAKETLVRGGIFVLVEPTRRWISSAKVAKFLIRAGSSAAQNNSPLTDFDFALVSAYLMGRLSQSDPRLAPSLDGGRKGKLSSMKQVIARAEAEGMKLQANEAALAGMARVLVFRNFG